MKFPPERFNVFFDNLTNSHHPGTEVTLDPDDQLPFASQDQSPISEPEPVAPTQDQAETGVFDTPFEEAVPLEDELASLLDDIDD